MKINNPQILGLSLRNMLSQHTIFLVLIGLIIILSISTPAFLTSSNLINMVRQTSFIAIIALGVLGVLISSGMDLSSGAVVGLTAVVVASFAHPGEYPMVVTIIMGLMIGLIVGFGNGLLVSFGKLPPFIATLATTSVARGFALLYNNGRPIGDIKEEFVFLGAGRLFGIPMPILVLLVIAVVTHLLLNNTAFGRHIYAIGGNENAAMISGINIKRVKIIIYTYAGVLASLSSIVLTARVQSGQPGAGDGYELDAIAAAVIGGSSLNGGVGTVPGVIVGSLIIGLIANGLDLLNVNAYWQYIAKGAVIAVAVFLDQRKKIA